MSSRVRSLAAGLCACLGLGGCKIAASRAWNLNELHDAETRHRYSGALQSDVEYVLRNMIAVGSVSLAGKTPIAIPDPANTCLENVIELEEYGDGDPYVAGLQVEWSSRLAVADPWKLTRERAVLGLGRAGKRLAPGPPAELPEGAAPAGPDAISEAVAGLVRSARPILDRGSGASETERLDLASAAEVVGALVLDIDGARRALHAAVELAETAGWEEPEAKPLKELCLDLERRCVRQALARALKDPEPRVRAAALEASVRTVGPEILDPILSQLAREPAPEVLVRAMDLVREVGLPEAPPEGSNATAEQARRVRLAAIYDLIDRPEGVVRVAAMRALESVSGAGFRSLREEDWQSWWAALREKPREQNQP